MRLIYSAYTSPQCSPRTYGGTTRRGGRADHPHTPTSQLRSTVRAGRLQAHMRSGPMAPSAAEKKGRHWKAWRPRTADSTQDFGTWSGFSRKAFPDLTSCCLGRRISLPRGRCREDLLAEIAVQVGGRQSQSAPKMRRLGWSVGQVWELSRKKFYLGS